MERVLPGEVAWYVTGRFYEREDKQLRDAGYFLHVQGIDAHLFNGKRGEGTAYLTFLAEPFTSEPVMNGGLAVGLDSVGEFAIYLNTDPAATFDDPESFGAGREVARFRRVGLVMGAEIGNGTSPALFSTNVFSARLVGSREFELGGQRYDFRRLMPDGITQWGTAQLTAAATLPHYASIVPFVGSAIAIGGGGEPAHGGPPEPAR
ncbi:MAG TPA: hypothetical protein VFH27_02780 [Longimicrobiaceae bacterium]|nr:hypothetical protein [Longimicrobiaceae bacterium]